MAGVGEDGAVLHHLEVLAPEDVLVAGRRDEEVPQPCRLGDRGDPEPVHDRLERCQRIDLDDDDVRPVPACPVGQPAAAPAVAAHDERLSGEQDVRGPDDPVDRRLAGAVAVVEEVLGVGLVHGDDREPERPGALHRPQADDARRRLLGAGEHVSEHVLMVLMERRDHVAAVVHRDVRVVVDRGADVAVVDVVRLAVNGVDGDPVLGDQRGRDLVLGRERVRRAQEDVGAPRLQGAGQVGGLGGHVQARRDAQARERALGREALADRSEDRHLPICPLHPHDAVGREAQVVDIRRDRRAHGATIAVQGSRPRWGGTWPRAGPGRPMRRLRA